MISYIDFYNTETNSIDKEKYYHWANTLGFNYDNDFSLTFYCGNNRINFKTTAAFPNTEKLVLDYETVYLEKDGSPLNTEDRKDRQLKTKQTPHYFGRVFVSCDPLAFPYTAHWRLIRGIKHLEAGTFDSLDSAICIFKRSGIVYEDKVTKFTFSPTFNNIYSPTFPTHTVN